MLSVKFSNLLQIHHHWEFSKHSATFNSYFNPKNVNYIQLFCVLWLIVIDLFSFECLIFPNNRLPFKITYLQSCRFYCVDIFCIEFRLCETFIIINSVTRILSAEILCKSELSGCLGSSLN